MAEDLENKTTTGFGILERYRQIDNKYLYVAGTCGGAMAAISMGAGKTVPAIIGVALLSFVPVALILDNSRAYFAAKLDYMQNGRFTALDEDKK